MSDQNNNKNAQPSSEKEPKNAGGVDELEEGEERVEGDADEKKAHQADGGRQSQGQRQASSDRDFGFGRKG